MPVRSVSNRGGNATGRFPSLKMGRMIQFESLVELDYIYLLDYDPNIKWFEEQPRTIEYQWEQKTLRYTPDFLVIRQGYSTLVECKPDQFVDTEENNRKFRAAELWCSEVGWTFSVVTTSQIRNGFRLNNIKFLTRYARYQPDVTIRSRIYDHLLGAIPPITIQVLAQTIFPDNTAAGIAAIFHMIFHDELTVELDLSPITESSLISISKREEHYE